jgi:hypothetical protein
VSDKHAEPVTVDLLDAAAAMPGVADLMRLYEQNARVVRTAAAFMEQTRPQVVVTAGAGTTSIAD